MLSLDFRLTILDCNKAKTCDRATCIVTIRIDRFRVLVRQTVKIDINC